MRPFVHLHVHSEYSLLDGLGRAEGLVVRAKELGMPALALTDHGAMYGAIEFYQAAQKHGIKPIIGIEMYIAPRGMKRRDPQKDRSPNHIILLAKDKVGYHNLLQIATAAELEGFYYKPRVDKKYLAEHAQGLIALSGCGSGEIPRLVLKGQLDKAREVVAWYRDAFGQGNFYLELQRHEGIPEFKQINEGLIALSNEMGIPLVATNDVHYVRPEEAKAQEILLCIQTNTTIKDPKRMTMGDESFYLKSGEEMAALFPDVPEAVENSLLIAEKCNLNLESEGYHLPTFEVPEGHDAESYLRHLCQQGLRDRYAIVTAEIEARLQHELRLIHQMGFDTYFLIVWDLVRHARDRDIWWNVRGSVAGSMVAYTLGITNLDPLKHGLIFERFLNPGRVTMPDIDLDFPNERRDEMIKYAGEKYGQDMVAQIITFGTMGARAAIRDAGRALDLPLNEVDTVAKMIPFGPKVKIQDGLEKVAELRGLYESKDYIKQLIDTAQSLEGVARHASTHAAGVVIADAPLINYTPLHRPTGGTDGGIVVTQYPMEALEDIGLLKIDFLGLSTLTIIRKAADLIRQNHGLQLDMNTISTEDPVIFELLSSGEVTGVFQVESSGMRRVLTDMQPTRFEDIVAVLALYRPGPMQFIPNYIARKHGREGVAYIHPKLEPILKDTYAIIVYQEQLIRTMTDLAGYSAADADLMRRAVGKKKEKELRKHRKTFIEGAVKYGGIEADEAREIFDAIEYFSNYGFNKCLPGDVEILDAASGRLFKIEDLYVGAAEIDEVVTCDTSTLKLRAGKVTAIADNGVKPVFQLTTALGRQIEATPNHPFYTPGGWRLLEELQPGDQIAVPRKLSVEGKAEWPDYEVIALGHLLAEGNLCHPCSVYYYTQDSEQLADYVGAVERFDNVECSIRLHKGTYSVYAKRIHRNEEPGVVRWAKALGIWGKRAPEKEIPSETFTLNNRQVALLLSRLWAGDGHLDRQDNYVYAYYATASKRLAHQVQHLLLRLGVVSRLRTVNFPYRGGRIGYQVHVLGIEHIRNFAANVGRHFINRRRREICAYVLTTEFDTARGTRDVVPLEVKEIVRAEKAAAGITWTQMRNEAGVAQRDFYPTSARSKRGFRRETIARLADYFDSNALRRYSEGDIFWDEIVSIKYIGQKQTYDLTVQGTHNFVANDILVHNSHAVSYAVITCQTAWLKAKYPVEYMAALLTVERNNTDKVGLFMAECRRMGIEILPPDVNRSGLDFTIETGADRAIRFGLGAVKNVGEGPVEAILTAREQNGPFKDIEDFCQRVDLRQVNRRALECLIKIGAFDAFGQRSQLLAVVDPLMALSQSTHQAQEVGQLSMFDASSGFSLTMGRSILLPDIPEVPRKEMLAWEKELVGFYVSEHPLQQVAASLGGTVTAFCGEIDEEVTGQKVVIAGVVTWVRPHMTKKGDPMAFVQLEDLRGSIEVIVFPSVYEKTRELWQEDKILVVKGRVDAKDRGPKVICESVQDYLLISRPADEDKYRPSRPRYLHITIPRTGKHEQDIERLGKVHSLLRSYEGDDHFSIYLVGDGKRVQLDFPNDTTGYCPALEEALIEMLGAGAINVE
ncbi:MAG: DNA polymerase III subunit alpha [Chloroflexi bacterium]|nr:DNA polymerase III subunit alpha [Chloroflexota bacterium]